MIVEDLLTAAYRIAGILRGPKRGLSNSQLLEGIDVLDSMLDSWSVDRLNIFTIKSAIYNLNINQQFYTIGIDPTGEVIADFNDDRPAELRNVNIITQVATGQPVRVPMSILEDDQWSKIPVLATGSSIPQYIYDDYNAPLSTLGFWPFPNASAQVEIYSWSALPQYADPGDGVSLAPGYRRAIELNLGVELNFRYPQFQMKPRADLAAREAYAMLQAKNVPAPVLTCDEALVNRQKGVFNYITGEPQ